MEQSFGKVVDTKGIVGRLYNMISKAIKDIKEPTYDFKYLDEDLLVNGREKYTEEATELLQKYNARVREIMQKNKFDDDEERKRIHFEMLEEEFKNIFLEGLNGSHDEAYKKASAWYEVCYKGTYYKPIIISIWPDPSVFADLDRSKYLSANEY